MNAIWLLLLSVVLYTVGAFAALSSRTSRVVAGVSGLLAALAGIIAAVVAMFETTPPSLALFSIAPFGSLVLQLDRLSAFLVGLITLIGAAASLYAMTSGPRQVNVGFFTNLFLAAMLLVVTTDNTFYFLVFWELMTLVSYFLIIWDSENLASVRTGYIYLLVAHGGAALIMLGFLILFHQTGSFDFEAVRQAGLSPAVRNLVFILAFLGFGAKAGMAPLHFWTPGAYAAAPSHASALMSGVMKKTAVYGILRVCVDLLGVTDTWWGFTVLAFGGFSTVIGAFYALAERDIKRLLAYSSVENVGIILMGTGLGMLGLAMQQPVLAVLGFLAALYHVLNHAFFKGLLFLGAGAIIEQAGTPDLNRMGGLGRRMPWTALAFLTGALAVTAIPPLNGFVSEWFTYQAFLTASQNPLFGLRVFAPLFAIMLALAGALALMVYIKAYASAFSGPARSQPAASAHEAPGGAVVSMFTLAIGCLALGLAAPFIVPLISDISASLAGVTPVPVASGWQVFPAGTSQAVLSMPLLVIVFLGLLVVPWLLIAIYGGLRAGQRGGVDPWTCGYGYSSRMSLPASSFDQPVRVSFLSLYRLRTLVDKPFRAITNFSQAARVVIQRVEPYVEIAVTRPTTRLVETAGQWIQALQMGDIRVYCLYIIITLAVLLIAIFGRSGL